MGVSWVVVGGVAAALGVAAGAFGAHGLAARLDERSLGLWETACRYWMYGAFGLLIVGILEREMERGVLAAAGWTVLSGMVVFSGTVGLLALGWPRWLGAVTPVGGVLLMIGFLLVAWSGLTG